MRKISIVIILFIMIISTGCQAVSAHKTVLQDKDGVSMVDLKEISDLLKMDILAEKDDVILKQDAVSLKLNIGSVYVYKDKHLMALLEKPAKYVDGRVYVPLAFFTNILKADIKIDQDDKVTSAKDNFSLYNVVKFLPENVLAAINDKNYPYRDSLLKVVEFPQSLEIGLPRINLKKVIDTKPLPAYARKDLIAHGYKFPKIINFALEDYNIIKGVWEITSEQINYAKEIYPELRNYNIENWTNNYYQAYYSAKDEQLFNNNQTQQLEQLKIPPHDIKLLYEATRGGLPLNVSEDDLKDILASQYAFIIEQITDLAENNQINKDKEIDPDSRLPVEEIDGILGVLAEDLARLLHLEFSIEQDIIFFKKDDILLKITLNNGYVYRDRYLLDVLEAKPTRNNGKVYIPVEFLADTLGVPLRSDTQNQIYIADSEFSLYNYIKFLPQEVVRAINDLSYPYRDEILKGVELPRSMNIQTPKINTEKIIVTTPLEAYAYDFKGILKNQGYTDEEIAQFTYEDYRVLESSWKLPQESIEATKRAYPELRHENLKNWTYGDKEAYSISKDKLALRRCFTLSQMEYLQKNGILLEDAFYLLKELYRPESIINCSPDEIKKIIEGYYQSSISMIRGMAGFNQEK